MLRRAKDPKRKEGKFFNSRQLLAGSTNVSNLMRPIVKYTASVFSSYYMFSCFCFHVKDEIQKYRAFMSRYAHFVLLRAQCFGGNFVEIAPRETDAKQGSKKKSRKPEKPITSVALRSEHLDAAKMILKAGCACALKNEEDNEITASCVERVAIDMNGLTTAVAVALNRALKGDEDNVDHAIVKKWCEFYSQELLPQTKSMIKKTSATLDSYGLFLPSRMGATVSQELLEKGMKDDDKEDEELDEATAQEDEQEPIATTKEEEADVTEKTDSVQEEVAEERQVEREAEPEELSEYEYDEYEYDEE